jgi:uncharacterized iron-regulated protein
MRKNFLNIFYFFVLVGLFSFADKPAYQLYSKEGKVISYESALKKIKEADVVLFGELHNNPIAHWLELSMLKDLPSNKLLVGAEMFESDEQSMLNRYLNDEISLEEFEKGADLWSNFSTDYAPILEYSKEKNIPVFATNCPRKYARIVAKKGISALDSLASEQKDYLPPLPVEMDITLPGYQNMLKESIHGESMWNNRFMAEAQALKDATMAHFIFKNLKPGFNFFHLNGAYHSDYFEGIYWSLKKKNKNLKIVTISTVEQKNIEKLDQANLNKADIIIAVPDDMTKTYR